jgi:hypothetical protein
MAPSWLGEGPGALFERASFSSDGSLHGMASWRLPRLRRALASAKEGDSVRVESVLSLEDRRFFTRWRASAATDPTGTAAFREVLGESPEDATPEWRAWVKGLAVSPR